MTSKWRGGGCYKGCGGGGRGLFGAGYGGNSSAATERSQGTESGWVGSYRRLELWLGLLLGCGNAFGVESGAGSWGAGGYPTPPSSDSLGDVGGGRGVGCTWSQNPRKARIAPPPPPPRGKQSPGNAPSKRPPSRGLQGPLSGPVTAVRQRDGGRSRASGDGRLRPQPADSVMGVWGTGGLATRGNACGGLWRPHPPRRSAAATPPPPPPRARCGPAVSSTPLTHPSGDPRQGPFHGVGRCSGTQAAREAPGGSAEVQTAVDDGEGLWKIVAHCEGRMGAGGYAIFLLEQTRTGQPPTATNRQPPTAANCQPPTASRQPPPTIVQYCFCGFVSSRTCQGG